MQEADSLKNQVDDLSNQFAAERSAYELLLDMEKASSPAVEELCEKLGQQKGRVGHLQKQLDQVIEKLTSLQEEVDISDSDADESALPFGQDNERDTEIGEVLQPVRLLIESVYLLPKNIPLMQLLLLSRPSK